MIGALIGAAELAYTIYKEAKESDNINELRFRIMKRARDKSLDKSLAKLVKARKKLKQ